MRRPLGPSGLLLDPNVVQAHSVRAPLAAAKGDHLSSFPFLDPLYDDLLPDNLGRKGELHVLLHCKAESHGHSRLVICIHGRLVNQFLEPRVPPSGHARPQASLSDGGWGRGRTIGRLNVDLSRERAHSSALWATTPQPVLRRWVQICRLSGKAPDSV